MSWQRKLGWSVGIIVAVLLFIVAAGYLYLRSSSFQQLALHKIVEEADTATGGKVQIGGLDFQLSTLTAHLHDITLRGTESLQQPPLVHADELTVQLKIVSALHRQVTLRELLIEHPAVHLQVSSDGKNNFPTPPPSNTSSTTSVFDLAVNHVQISNGEIIYKDQKTPLDADLYHLGTNIHFESSQRRYIGTISYQNGSLHYADYSPLPHNLELHFSADPQRFQIDPAMLNIGSSSVRFSAQVSDYSHPVANGNYTLRIHTQDFAALSPSVSPAGDVEFVGTLGYRSAENEPLLRSVSVDGRVASDLLTAATSGKRIEARNVHATYRLAGGNLEVTNLGLQTYGGTVAGKFAMRHLDTQPESTAHATLAGISLRTIQQQLGRQTRQTANLSGQLRGTADASWKADISNLHAHSDLFLEARASGTANSSGQEVPINGAVHVDYDGLRQTIQVRDTTIKIPSATLSAQGTISNHSSLQIQLIATDLNHLALLASSFRPSPGPSPSVSGSATLNATIQGAVKKPSIAVQLEGRDLHVEGSEWRSAHLTMHATDSRFVIDHAEILNAQQGQLALDASVALKHWQYEQSSAIKAHASVQKIRLTDIQALAGQKYPISGDLSVNLDFDGSELHPSGSGSARVANAQVYGESLQDAALKFQAANGSINSTLTVSTAAGSIDANLSYVPQTKAYKVHLDAPGVAVQKLKNVQEKNLPITGTITASMNGEGTLDDPGLTATVKFPQLQVRQNTISGFQAEVRVAQHQAHLNLDTRVSEASIHAHGTVSLSGEYQTEATIDTDTIPIEGLLAAYAPSVPQGFEGKTAVHASLKGPLKDKSRVVAHLEIPVLEAKYQALELAIPRPIKVDYANSVATLQPAEIRGTGTTLRAEGRIPVSNSPAATLSAQGSIDLRILKMVSPNLQSTGTLALDVRSSGMATQPNIQGQLKLDNVALTAVDAPIGVEQLNGVVDITGDRAQVTKMTARVGGGEVSLGGSVNYRPSVHFNLAVQSKSVRLRYPDGLRSVLDAHLALSGTPQASIVNGRVLIDSLSFTSDFDLSTFADQFSSTNTPSQPGFADTVQLAVDVQSQGLNATSSQVSIAGQAALHIGGNAANPVITGRTTLTSGELFYRNVRYALQRGIITFDDPNETHPVMNVSVTTTIEQYNLTLTLRGPLDTLTTAYVSDPPLATADIINLVARGKTTQEQAASSQSTDSMIASGVASQLSSGVQKLAGLSSLQIDPTLGGNNTNPSARVAFQQRVTKNLLFSFSTDVSQPGSEIVQGEYQINKRWSVSMERDQLGGVSVDGKYHKKF